MKTKSSPKKSESPKMEKEANPNSCVLPEDIIIVCILTRLSVKSIIRFKSVCKLWLRLFSTPEFIKSHCAQFSSDPKNESIIFYSKTFPSTLYLLNPDSNDKKPTAIFREYGLVNFVGCCNGLICVFFDFALLHGQDDGVILLWNSATRRGVSIPIKYVDDFPGTVSLGFGYDAERDDFKVVRIVNECGIEVYSANSGSSTEIEVGFEFHVERDKNDAIVNGNPCWVGLVGEDVVLLCFDVTRLVLKTVPPPPGVEMMKCKLVDLDGALGAIGWNFVGNEMAEPSLDIWVFGDGDRVWRKNNSLSLGPIQASFCSVLACLRNGNLVGDRRNGQLFVFDPDHNGCVDKIVIGDARRRKFEVYGHTESLRRIDGMRSCAELNFIV